MNAWYVYIVRCNDSSLYVGITNDLEKRIFRHNSGDGAKYTRYRRPVTLAWKQKAVSEGEARKRESQLKRWTRLKKENLINFGHPAGKQKE